MQLEIFRSGRRLLRPVAAGKGLGRDPLLLDEDLNQRLHGLHLFVRNQAVVLGNGNKVDEAHVEDVMLVDVPERIEPMGVIEMSVATEHLLHDTLAILVESLREATGFSNPVFRAGVGRVDLIEGKGLGKIVRLFSREHDRVMNLADDPLLNAVDEFGSRNLSRTAVHQPGVCQATVVSQVTTIQDDGAYRPADIVGQVESLQMGRPVTALTSWITCSIP